MGNFKIKRDSWHYKLLNKFENSYIWWIERSGRVNLCPYVRMVCKVLLMLLFAILAFTLAVVIPITAFTVDTIGLCDVLGYNKLCDAMYFVGFAETMMALMIALYYFSVEHEKGTIRAFKGWVDGKRNRPVVEKDPNIFMAWLNAKHDKICPIVKID